MNRDFLLDFVARVSTRLKVELAIPKPAPPRFLRRLPEALVPFYRLADGLDTPFLDFYPAQHVLIEIDHEVPDSVLDPAWCIFGSDGWAASYLCPLQPKRGKRFALWDPYVHIPVVPAHSDLVELMNTEFERFLRSRKRRASSMLEWHVMHGDERK